MIVRNSVLILLAMAGFGIVHSLTAGLALKERLKPLLGERLVEGTYRLAYNVLSVFTLLPVAWLLLRLPDMLLYEISGPLALLMRLGQVVGVVGLIGAVFVTDVWRFAGLKQLAAYIEGDPLPLPEPPLVARGMYRLVRHPLYFFSLLAIWLTPVMTLNVLLFNIGATLYFVIGSRIEERRLLRVYGDAYRQYRRQVRWMLPLPPYGRGDGQQSDEPVSAVD